MKKKLISGYYFDGKKMTTLYEPNENYRVKKKKTKKQVEQSMIEDNTLGIGEWIK